MRGAPVTRMIIDAVEEKGGLQYVSGRSLSGETFKRVLRLEPHGAAGSPPIGSIGIVMAMGGNRDQLLCIGSEKAGVRPTGIGAGESVIYNAHGQAISLVTNEIRVAAGAKFHVVADSIVLEGIVKLGGEGASRPASLQGTVDTGGFADTSNLATKVFGE
jgi:phage baseplate assembly protein V